MGLIHEATTGQLVLGAALIFYVTIGALLVRQNYRIEKARKERRATQCAPE